jgi:hypothetical protein
MAVSRCRPKVRRPMKARAEPAARAAMWSLGVKRVCQRGVKAGAATAAVERRKGARNSAPIVPGERTKGSGEKRRERDVVRPQREAYGRTETMARSAVVGVMKARGAWRRVVRSGALL